MHANHRSQWYISLIIIAKMEDFGDLLTQFCHNYETGLVSFYTRQSLFYIVYTDTDSVSAYKTIKVNN